MQTRGWADVSSPQNSWELERWVRVGYQHQGSSVCGSFLSVSSGSCMTVALTAGTRHTWRINHFIRKSAMLRNASPLVPGSVFLKLCLTLGTSLQAPYKNSTELWVCVILYLCVSVFPPPRVLGSLQPSLVFLVVLQAAKSGEAKRLQPEPT